MHVLLQLVAGTQLDSFLDKLFAWFRGPKEEEDAPMHEERAPHEAAEERPAESEERFHDFRHEERAYTRLLKNEKQGERSASTTSSTRDVPHTGRLKRPKQRKKNQMRRRSRRPLDSK